MIVAHHEVVARLYVDRSDRPTQGFGVRKKKELMAQRVVGYEVASRIAIPEGDSQKFYDEHKADFVRQEQVFLSQILISTDGKTAEQAAAAADSGKDISARAKKGEKFSDLARDNSDDLGTAQNGGYLGAPSTRGTLRPELEAIVFKEKKGFVTEPIKLNNPPGFLILKVEEHFEAGQASFEEVQEDIHDLLVRPRLEPKVREFLTQLRQQAYLQIKDGYVDSGAVSDKKGLIPSAEGGTLFLDEIADLPLHMQVKLLRVIQEKAVRPVGEQHEIGIDVRFLSATHKNLAQLVAEGKFREDLFYRVNVIELRVPSLRERREDVPELAEAVVRRLGRGIEITPPTLSKEALAALETYAFPGNVRELENILERAITMSTGGEVRSSDIQLRPTPVGSAAAPNAPNGGALGDHLEDIERDAILKALEQTRYNRSAAAKALGMSFRALRYRIKKLGIE